MERVCGRWEKMKGQCSTGQSPQWAVVPMGEEEEEEKKRKEKKKKNININKKEEWEQEEEVDDLNAPGYNDALLKKNGY